MLHSHHCWLRLIEFRLSLSVVRSSSLLFVFATLDANFTMVTVSLVYFSFDTGWCYQRQHWIWWGDHNIRAGWTQSFLVGFHQASSFSCSPFGHWSPLSLFLFLSLTLFRCFSWHPSASARGYSCTSIGDSPVSRLLRSVNNDAWTVVSLAHYRYYPIVYLRTVYVVYIYPHSWVPAYTRDINLSHA